MENSAYDAVIIAVNTLIFMVAVSIGMLLMTTVNRMVEYTKQIADSEIGGNLIQEFGDIQKRTYTGAEVYAVYGQALKGELTGYTIRVRSGGSTSDIKTYGSQYGMAQLNATFVLDCTGTKSYTFIRED